MTLLDVTPAGLDTLAGNCGIWAGEVAVTATPEVPIAIGHASAAAVAAIHTRVRVSAEALAARMGATAEKLTNTAVTFSAEDEQSASRISGISFFT